MSGVLYCDLNFHLSPETGYAGGVDGRVSDLITHYVEEGGGVAT